MLGMVTFWKHGHHPMSSQWPFQQQSLWNCGSPTKKKTYWFSWGGSYWNLISNSSHGDDSSWFHPDVLRFWVVGLNICRNPCITMVSCRFPICILPFLWCSGKPCLWLPMVREGSPLGSCGSNLDVLKMGCSMLENEQKPSRFKASNLERQL